MSVWFCDVPGIPILLFVVFTLIIHNDIVLMWFWAVSFYSAGPFLCKILDLEVPILRQVV